MKGFTLELVCPLALKTFLWMLNYCTLNKKYCNNAFLINFTSPRKKFRVAQHSDPLETKYKFEFGTKIQPVNMPKEILNVMPKTSNIQLNK